MESLYIFLIRNDVWIYILCGLIFFWNVSRLSQARSLLRQAIFGLEKERGQQMQRRALTLILIAVAISALVTYVNVQVAPTIPADRLKPPTPTPNIFATPLSSPTPLGTPQPQASATLPIAPTVTLAGQGNPIPDPSEPLSGTVTVPTDVAPPPTEVADNCPPNAIITAPPDGVAASGSITFFGTATGDSFGSYDLQANGPETSGLWRSLLPTVVTESVIDGILAQINLSSWVPGSYLVRLVVSSTDDTEAGQCQIQIVLQ
jgi:hypothetical protein